MPADENNEDSSFGGFFSPIEQLFADFERLFSSVPNIFAFPSSQDFDEKSSSSSSNNLRDEVLKQDSQNHKDVEEGGTSLFDHLFQDLQSGPRRGDDNLDTRIEQHGLDEALRSSSSSSTKMTTMERRTTESGRCYEERRIEHSSTPNGTSQIETKSKICGDKHHTTVKENGRILREYGNATPDELNQIDSLSDDDDQPILGGQRHSDFFKKLFSS